MYLAVVSKKGVIVNLLWQNLVSDNTSIRHLLGIISIYIKFILINYEIKYMFLILHIFILYEIFELG